MNINPRGEQVARVLGLLRRFPVVGIVGARQVGKTTIAHLVAEQTEQPVTFFDLENSQDLSRLTDPMLTIGPLRGLVILDEVQRQPDIFPAIRVLADRPGWPARFLVLGSAAPGLLQQTAETLAGRIYYHQIRGFGLSEVGGPSHAVLWRRGGFPRSYLAESESESVEWRRGFLRTFVERDVPQLGITIGATTVRRFWTMLAHYHGHIWNGADLARSFGVADTTVRRYLDILTSTLVVRQLHPWLANLRKRQVKSPKVYIEDSGLLHALLNLPSQDDLDAHPKSGASWEGFIVGELIQTLRAEPEECFFWATHAGAELDLLVVRGVRRLGFEVKRTTSPTVTPSMRSALQDLELESIDVIHAGETTYQLTERVRAVAVTDLLSAIAPLEQPS